MSTNNNQNQQSQNNNTSTNSTDASDNFMKIYWSRLDTLKSPDQKEKARQLYSSFMLNHPSTFRDLWSDEPITQKKAQSALESYIPIYLAQKKQQQKEENNTVDDTTAEISKGAAVKQP